MRFALMYVKDAIGQDNQERGVSGDHLLNDPEELRLIEGLVDGWIAKHIDTSVECLLCQKRAVVSPSIASDMVVFVVANGSGIVLCEDCSAALAFSSIKTLDRSKAQSFLGRMIVDFLDSDHKRVENYVVHYLAQTVLAEKTAKFLDLGDAKTTGGENGSMFRTFAGNLKYQT